MSTERDLILKLQQDDSSAFDYLYWKYHDALYRNALKLTKDEQASLDILQDVFTILWEKRTVIKPEQSISGWLFIICFNQSVNFQRQKVREMAIYNAEENEHKGEMEDKESYELQYSLVEKAIQKLSPQKQKVFTLCKLHGKTYEEAASILNISKHTVKEYLSFAMSSIKEFLRDFQQNSRQIFPVILLYGFSVY